MGTMTDTPQSLLERNPLHAEALVLADIVPGMTIRRYYDDGPSVFRYRVVGLPYQQGRRWMLSVLTIIGGQSCRVTIYLDDSGVTPYDGDASQRRWNDSSYTLTVK